MSIFRVFNRRPKKSGTLTISTNSHPSEKELSLKSYLIEEIKKTDIIKPDEETKALSHLLGEIDLLKIGSKLTAEEKRALNLNTRISMTKELLSIFSESAIKSGNPKALISNLHMKANTKYSIFYNLTSFKLTGISKFEFIVPDDAYSCSWCKDQNNKRFNVNTDFITLIEKNCTCDPITRGCICAYIK